MASKRKRSVADAQAEAEAESPSHVGYSQDCHAGGYDAAEERAKGHCDTGREAKRRATGARRPASSVEQQGSAAEGESLACAIALPRFFRNVLKIFEALELACMFCSNARTRCTFNLARQMCNTTCPELPLDPSHLAMINALLPGTVLLRPYRALDTLLEQERTGIEICLAAPAKRAKRTASAAARTDALAAALQRIVHERHDSFLRAIGLSLSSRQYVAANGGAVHAGFAMMMDALDSLPQAADMEHLALLRLECAAEALAAAPAPLNTAEAAASATTAVLDSALATQAIGCTLNAVPLTIDEFIDHVRQLAMCKHQLISLERWPARPASTVPFSALRLTLAPCVLAGLQARGITSLYTHQAATIEAVLVHSQSVM